MKKLDFLHQTCSVALKIRQIRFRPGLCCPDSLVGWGPLTLRTRLMSASSRAPPETEAWIRH